MLFYSCIIQKRNNSYTPPQPIFKQNHWRMHCLLSINLHCININVCRWDVYPYSTVCLSDSQVLRNRLHVNLIQAMDVIHICLGDDFLGELCHRREFWEGYWFCTVALMIANQMNGDFATPDSQTIKFPIKAIPQCVVVNYRSLVLPLPLQPNQSTASSNLILIIICSSVKWKMSQVLIRVSLLRAFHSIY